MTLGDVFGAVLMGDPCSCSCERASAQCGCCPIVEERTSRCGFDSGCCRRTGQDGNDEFIDLIDSAGLTCSDAGDDAQKERRWWGRTLSLQGFKSVAGAEEPLSRGVCVVLT